MTAAPPEAPLGEVYWGAARERKIAQGGTVPSSWALLDGHLKEICEAGASAVAAHLAAQDARPAPTSASQVRRYEAQPAPELAAAPADRAPELMATLAAPRELAAAMAETDRIVRDILESLCRRFGLPLDSTVEPGDPARNYELAGRLGIGRVFGLDDAPAPDGKPPFLGTAWRLADERRVQLADVADLATEMHREADASADDAKAAALHEYAARIRRLLGPEAS